LFESKQEAIRNGWARIDEQQATIEKRIEAISKKKANLTKHSL
jgi:hypothetical protein